MSEPAHDQASRLQAATDSTLAKAMARFVMPALVALIAYFSNDAFNDIRANQEKQAVSDQQQSLQIAEVRSDVRLLNAKVDFSVLQQIENLERRINLLETQNNVLRTKP